MTSEEARRGRERLRPGFYSNLGHLKEANEYREWAFQNRDRLSARERYYIEGHYYWPHYDEYAQTI